MWMRPGRWWNALVVELRVDVAVSRQDVHDLDFGIEIPKENHISFMRNAAQFRTQF